MSEAHPLTISLDEAALIHAVALNTQTDEEIALRFGITQADLRARQADKLFVQKVLNMREELAVKGKDIERRSQNVLTEFAIPRAVEMMQDPELTPKELVELGQWMYKMTGADRKQAVDPKVKQMPSISIFLQKNSDVPGIRILSPSSLSINSDVEDVPFVTEGE
jgi:hypothetical protein